MAQLTTSRFELLRIPFAPFTQKRSVASLLCPALSPAHQELNRAADDGAIGQDKVPAVGQTGGQQQPILPALILTSPFAHPHLISQPTVCPPLITAHRLSSPQSPRHLRRHLYPVNLLGVVRGLGQHFFNGLGIDDFGIG